jgi:hypothetical protein
MLRLFACRAFGPAWPGQLDHSSVCRNTHWQFPFSHIIRVLVIMLISFAYLEEAGVPLGISRAVALASFSVIAATVWATVRATGLLEKLLWGV